MKPKIFFIFSYMFFSVKSMAGRWRAIHIEVEWHAEFENIDKKKKILVVEITPFLEQRHPVGEIAFYAIKILELELKYTI